jgi:parallel beta-helix repeat protein
MLELANSPAFTIANSTLIGAGSSGGAVDGIASDSASGDLVIRENTITNCGRYGINLASQGNVVQDNTINRNLSHGIFVGGSTNLVERNRIGHNSGAGINFANATGPHVYRNNVLRGNTGGGVSGVSGNTDAGGNVM